LKVWATEAAFHICFIQILIYIVTERQRTSYIVHILEGYTFVRRDSGFCRGEKMTQSDTEPTQNQNGRYRGSSLTLSMYNIS